MNQEDIDPPVPQQRPPVPQQRPPVPQQRPPVPQQRPNARGIYHFNI